MSRLLIVAGVCAVVCGAWTVSVAEKACCPKATVEVSVKTAVAEPADKAPDKTRGKQKLPAGFKRLFDGKTLKGWKGRKTLWKVVDGVIVGQTRADAKLKHNDFLYTEKEYGDFELRLKYKLTNHNSGVQIRSKVHKDFRVTGYQADMAEKRYTGILYGEGMGRGILADVDPKKMAKVVKKGKWNEYRILCKGKTIQLWLNGQPTIKFTETKGGSPTKGVIAFQLHGGPPMKVEFKDVIIKELPKDK